MRFAGGQVTKSDMLSLASFDPYAIPSGPAARIRLAALSTIAAILVEEVSQPITAAISYLHAGAARLRDREKQGAVLPTIEEAEREMGRAAEIVRRMHLFVASGRIAGETESLRELLAAASADPVCPDEVRARIETAIEPDAERVLVDRNLAGHVLSTLFARACDALVGLEQRLITVRAKRRQGMVAIRIQDSGPGLTDYQFIHLFEPLLTATGAGKAALALPICRTIAEAHGGRLWAERPGPGGAAFCLLLPAAD